MSDPSHPFDAQLVGFSTMLVVNAVSAALVERGLELPAPPQSPPWGGWRCFAQDPDGYLLEIEQP